MTLRIRTCLTMLLIVIGSLTVRANDNNYLLALTYTNDSGKQEVAYIKLTDKPTLSLASQKLEISGSNISLLYDQVLSITFVDKVTTSIGKDSVASQALPKIICLNNSMVSLSGLSKETSATLYNVEGKEITHRISDKEGYVSIPLANLQNGTYIIKTQNKSFKIIKK